MNTPLAQYEAQNIGIRPFKQDDIQVLHEFLTTALVSGEVPFTPSTSLVQFTKWLSEKGPGQHRFVACSDQSVHGLVILTQNLRPRLQHSGSITLLVDSRYLPDAITKALITAAVEMADKWLNLSRLQIELPASDQPFLNSIEAHGFEVEGRRRIARLVENQWDDNLLLARIRPGFHPQVSNNRTAISYSSLDSISKKRILMDLEIRPVRVEDASGEHEILKDRAIDRMTLQLPSIELLDVEERLKKSSPWLHRLTAIADAKVVGSISMAQNDLPGYTHIGRIGMKVHRDYWGMGIGTALLEKIMDIADRRLNIMRIELDVNTDNPAGIHLYKKCGFIIEGTKRYHTFGDGRWADSFFMARLKQQ